jgi:hypothetical protein
MTRAETISRRAKQYFRNLMARTGFRIGARLVATVGIAVGLYIGFLWVYGAQKEAELNRMSDGLERAEKPKEAFSHLADRIEAEGYEGRNNPALDPGRVIDGKRFESRTQLAELGLLDMAITGGIVIEAAKQHPMAYNVTENPNQKDLSARCLPRDTPTCRDSQIDHVFKNVAAEWLRLLTGFGGEGPLWTNETAARAYGSYLRRAEYYDSRLADGAYELKEFEDVAYDSGTLYVTGDASQEILLDGSAVSFERKGLLMRTNVSLDPGRHTLSTESENVTFLVFGEIENVVEDETGVFIEASDTYHRVVVEGGQGSESFNLETNLTVKRSNFPSETYIESNGFDNETRYRPYNITFMSSDVNITRKRGEKAGVNEPDDFTLHLLGFNSREYRKMEQISKELEWLTPIDVFDRNLTIPEGYGPSQ